MTAAPLDLRELFATPWEGSATVELPRWLRWFPAPRHFGFRSEIVDVDGDRWDVVDTATLPGGEVHARRMHARRVAEDRVRVTADDMPGGAEIRTRADGFGFTPYVIRTSVLGPLRIPLRFRDEVVLRDRGATLVDRIEIRFVWLPVARVTMRLHRAIPDVAA